MAAIGNAPFWKTTEALTVYNGTGSTISPYLILVADASYHLGAKLPGTSQVVQAIKGVAQAEIDTGTFDQTFAKPGDTVVCKANGAVAKGDTLYLDVSSGNEGKVAKYTDFATDGSEFIVGVADSACADEGLCSVILGGGYRNGAA